MSREYDCSKCIYSVYVDSPPLLCLLFGSNYKLINIYFENQKTFFQANIKTLLNNINKTAAEGQPAVSVKLVNPDNGAQVNILDYAK